MFNKCLASGYLGDSLNLGPTRPTSAGGRWRANEQLAEQNKTNVTIKKLKWQNLTTYS